MSFLNPPEYECMFLFGSFIIILNHHQCELFLLEVKSCNFRPKEKSNLSFPFKNQDSGRGEPETENKLSKPGYGTEAMYCILNLVDIHPTKSSTCTDRLFPATVNSWLIFTYSERFDFMQIRRQALNLMNKLSKTKVVA